MVCGGLMMREEKSGRFVPRETTKTQLGQTLKLVAKEALLHYATCLSQWSYDR